MPIRGVFLIERKVHVRHHLSQEGRQVYPCASDNILYNWSSFLAPDDIFFGIVFAVTFKAVGYIVIRIKQVIQVYRQIQKEEVRAWQCREAECQGQCFLQSVQLPKYQLELYQSLHPEDTDTKESDITTVTLQTVIINEIYNDLGMLVHGRLLILVEEQSSWSINILIRIILYFAGEWKKHIQDTEQSIYSSGRVSIPKPEFYVIYTGEDKSDVKPEYSLADEFFDGDGSFIDAKIRIITDGIQGDIISQYVTFTKVLNEQVREYGRTKEAIRKTIEICKSEDTLAEYLEEHEKEVVDIMDILYDRDYNMKILNKEHDEKVRDEGITLGADNRSIQIYNNCLDKGMSEQDAISISLISDKSLSQAREQRKIAKKKKTRA